MTACQNFSQGYLKIVPCSQKVFISKLVMFHQHMVLWFFIYKWLINLLQIISKVQQWHI